SISGEKVSEGSGALTFTITREGPDLSKTLEVVYNIGGSDGFRSAEDDDFVGGLPGIGSVLFDVGQSVATVTLNIAPDSVSEFHELTLAQLIELKGEGAEFFEIGTGLAIGEVRNDDGV